MKFIAPLTLMATAAMAADGWYEKDAGENQHPENIEVVGDKITMTVKPDANSCKLSSTQTFTQGRFEIKLKSASKMPGVITAIYLASGEGRKGDEQLGDQDEIDFEFKGNEPTSVQTNVFLNGQEDLKILDTGKDTSAEARNYAIEWNDATISFFIDNENVRTVNSGRALKPLKLSMSVWTTVGGWPGLKKWAGETNWDGQAEISAEIEVVSLPK